jgi:hypothetical protein
LYRYTGVVFNREEDCTGFSVYKNGSELGLAWRVAVLLVNGIGDLHIGVFYDRQDLHTWRDIDNGDLPNDSVH